MAAEWLPDHEEVSDKVSEIRTLFTSHLPGLQDYSILGLVLPAMLLTLQSKIPGRWSSKIRFLSADQESYGLVPISDSQWHEA